MTVSYSFRTVSSMNISGWEGAAQPYSFYYIALPRVWEVLGSFYRSGHLAEANVS
jgi:hypothetical protein